MPSGHVTLREPLLENTQGQLVPLPCGTCLGCRTTRARHWAVRCQLELKRHTDASFATLTYDDAHLPPTLTKPHLTKWLKRLRERLRPNKLRFFASGEYGEKTSRPHYHAILYGTSNAELIQDTWYHGNARTDPCTPAAIAYVAGYCSKKIGWQLDRGERVDPDTGEVYDFQPPFIQMSRNPGIAAYAKQQYANSWRTTAILNGQQIPVPHYLHEAWKNNATTEAVAALEAERLEAQHARNRQANASGDPFFEHNRLLASRVIAEAKHKLRSNNRDEL